MAQGLKKKDIQQVAEMMKAIAHPERIAIVKLLLASSDRKLSVKYIYEKLNLQQPVASHHLTILKSAGVVRRTRDGQKIYYCICQEKKAVESITKCLS